MSINIVNARNINLDALVNQLGTTKVTKDGQELRTKPKELPGTQAGQETGRTLLYAKTNISNRFASKDSLVKREKHQEAARTDIRSALLNQFGNDIGTRVIANMNGFFGGGEKVTAGDARAVLANARAEVAIDARKAEVENHINLFDTQNHPVASGLFVAHCQREISTENFDFVQAVRAHRAIPEDANGATQKIDSANALITEFGTNGARPVNLPSHEKLSQLVDGNNNNLSAAQKNTLLDAAEATIIKLAGTDSAKRFIASDAGQNYINNG
jgi:hypothetical protein